MQPKNGTAQTIVFLRSVRSEIAIHLYDRYGLSRLFIFTIGTSRADYSLLRSVRTEMVVDGHFDLVIRLDVHAFQQRVWVLPYFQSKTQDAVA